MPDPADRSTARYRRTIVTEEALSVSPEVIGLPLARPWRRLCAILVDLLLVWILARNFGVFFGFVAAYVLFRVSFRPTVSGGYLKRSFRFMLRTGGALMLFVGVVVLWREISDRFDGGDEEGRRTATASVTIDGDRGVRGDFTMTPVQGLRFGRTMASLATADNEEKARAAAADALASMRGAGLSGADARETIRQVAESTEDRPWIASAIDRVLEEDAIAHGDGVTPAAEATPDAVDTAPADSVVAAFAAALAQGDTLTADSLRPGVVALLAADTVAALDREIAEREEEIEELEEEGERLRERVDELNADLEEGPGMMAFLRAVMEDLGIGLGWFGLYFTATTAMWQGRTAGKRLFGIRVISLTGKPIGWWASFERFGGYAAGFATGLLGFLQIYWDDNRQAIHDKIAVTAVVRDLPDSPAPR